MNWMNEKDTARYEEGIRVYLKEIGHVERLVEFQWGYEACVAVMDEEARDYNHHYYTFEYMGKDQFIVYYKWTDFNDEDYEGDGFGPEHTESCGTITIV